MTHATLKSDGSDALQRTLASLRARVMDMTPAMRSIGARQVRETEKNFRAEGRPKKWKKSDRAKKGGGLTLTKSGRLRRSVTWNADKHSVNLSANTAYAPVHQFGFRGSVKQSVKAHKRKMYGKQVQVKGYERTVKMNIPARPYIVITPADHKAIGRIILKHLGVTR